MYKPVTRIRITPDGSEDRSEVKAHIQSSVAFLPITADVEEADLLERKLPNGKTQTIRLTQVTHYEAPGAGQQLNHIEAKFVSARSR
ncbi:hypothetical protein [Nocardiopsis metallicus]|uniref:Uncharacterized protein n=2 Tax=Nocardiopsis metallicus TaxID=179819 RepID=A0A840WMS9_9ACTN|nr:hypothetical protein [Nocardiopsis metallicus]MBB5491428.1 hypothetical protein [Nocardiopsis metallicus]